MEYLEDLEGIEGEEGGVGVPGDLGGGGGGGGEFGGWEGLEILVRDWSLLWRRSWSEICFWWCWRRRKGWALALFQREKRISVGEEDWWWGEVGVVGRKRGKGKVDLRDIGI